MSHPIAHPFCKSNTQLEETCYEKVKSLFDQKKYEETINFCETCQDDYDFGHDIWELNGDSYLLLNKNNDAISSYES